MSLKTVISMAAVILCAGPVGRVPFSVGGTQPMPQASGWMEPSLGLGQMQFSSVKTVS